LNAWLLDTARISLFGFVDGCMVVCDTLNWREKMTGVGVLA
jgi:hypothetical protein